MRRMATRREFLAATAAASSTLRGAITASPVDLVSVPGNGIQPQIAFSGSRIHLVYLSGDPKHCDVHYARSDDHGRTFSPSLRVNSQDGSAIAMGTIRGAQIALGGSGRVHVAWNGSQSGKSGAPMLYTRLDEQGTAFEPQRNLMQMTSALDGGGSVTADPRGNVFVAWHGKAEGAPEGEAGRQVWIARSGDEGKNFAKEKPATSEPTGACAFCSLRLFSDSRGVLYGLYRSATSNVHRDIYLLESQDRGRSFRGRKLDTWQINACPMSSMAFAEAGGRIEGAWETSGHVFFKDLKKASALPVGATNEDKNSKHPRLAITPGGETVMVWTEGTGWARGGSLAWQLFDEAGKPLGEKHTARGVPTWSVAAVVPQPRGAVIMY